MRGKILLTPVLFVIGWLAVLFAGTGCATIVPPSGGLRDTLPPVLVKSLPADMTTDFDESHITLNFDEYIDLDNYQQNVIVSPMPKQFPSINRKLTAISIKLRDTLEPNTTYTLNFGRSIKDINEGNVFREFTYTFSTGAYIDSFQLRGNVVLAETGATDSTLTILLHRSGDDSAVIKTKPRYIAKTDGQGNFVFKNLPSGIFYLYALKDQGSLTYTSPQTIFAFADSSITTGPGIPKPVTLYAYDIKETEKPAVPAVAAKPKKGEERRLKFSTSLKDRQDLLSKLVFTFDTPLRSFDSTKLRLTMDSTYTPATDYRFIPDSNFKTLTLEYKWKENTLYHFIIDKDFATDTLGLQLLRADTIDFNTRGLNEYGKFSLRLRNLDLSKHPVLQFVQNNEVVNSIPLEGTTVARDMFLPGEYYLRILEDRNGNGVWDPGSFPAKRLQPELVKPIERKLNLKAGPNLPVEIDVTAKAAPGTGKPGQPGSRAGTAPGSQPATNPASGRRDLRNQPLFKGN